MYKIVNITDKKGNVKQDVIEKLKSSHPNMSGEILYSELTKVDTCFCFVWNDNIEKMLRTTVIKEYENNDDNIRVVTQNSIYYLEKENN